MSYVMNYQLRLAEIERLHAQQHYADVEMRCHQLLEKCSSEPADLIV